MYCTGLLPQVVRPLVPQPEGIEVVPGQYELFVVIDDPHASEVVGNVVEGHVVPRSVLCRGDVELSAAEIDAEQSALHVVCERTFVSEAVAPAVVAFDLRTVGQPGVERFRLVVAARDDYRQI